MNELHTYIWPVNASCLLHLLLSVLFSLFFIMTCTMHGIFRFSFSSHQINQFYEQQIGELDPMHSTIQILLSPSLFLFFVTNHSLLFVLRKIPPSLKKRKMNARLLCDMDMHRHHPLIMSTKIVCMNSSRYLVKWSTPKISRNICFNIGFPARKKLKSIEMFLVYGNRNCLLFIK